jgi:hypothetical protein
MNKSIASLILAGAAALMLLGGCNKATESSPKIDAPTAPTAPDKPDAPAAVSAEQSAPPTPAASALGTAAAAEASVSASGTEARAGDVSVKLPQ